MVVDYLFTMKQAFTVLILVATVLVVLTLRAQDGIETTPVIPIGDGGKGRTLFEEKLCSRCHTVEGAKFPDSDLPAIDFIPLASNNNRGWNRDFYAAQIMNPQHLISPEHQKVMVRIGDRLGEVTSPMLNFNKNLTVQELIDIVTFLEEKSNQVKR